MRARQLIEVETSTLVIHLEDRSTDFLKAIYKGKGYPVISGATTEEKAEKAIRSYARIFMLGHGSPGGLFGRGLFYGDQFGPALAEKTDGLYIWCNADAYAVRNKLTGLVSGMFISEVGEAAMFGIKATQDEVDASNDAFARIVRETMDKGGAHDLVRQCYASSNAACKITKFNSDRLYVFDHGTPTPALHRSSHGLPKKEPEYYRAPADDRLSLDDELALENYLSQAAQDIVSGAANFEDAINSIYHLLDEYVPGTDAEEIGRDLWQKLEEPDFNPEQWAYETVYQLTKPSGA